MNKELETKLTAESVAAIRSGGRPYLLAKQYGVSRRMIYYIRTWTNWKYLSK